MDGVLPGPHFDVPRPSKALKPQPCRHPGRFLEHKRMLRVSVSRKHIGKVPEQSLSNNQWHSNGKLSLYHFQRVLWKSEPKSKIWHRSSHISLYFFHWSHHSPVMGGTPDVKGGPPLAAQSYSADRARAADSQGPSFWRDNSKKPAIPPSTVGNHGSSFPCFPTNKKTKWKDTTKVTICNKAIILCGPQKFGSHVRCPIFVHFRWWIPRHFFPSGTSPPRFHLLNLIPVFDE